MNLRTLFAIPIAVILIVTLSLAGMVAGQGWSSLVRGRAAIAAVERMRLLLALQTDLRAERIVTNFVLGRPRPLTEPAQERLAGARRETDRAVHEVAADLSAEAEHRTGVVQSEQYLDAVIARLGAMRGVIDQLLARDLGGRTLDELNAVMPGMVAVAELIDGPRERASLAVTAADASLSGLLTDDMLAESLRDQVALIATVLLPRFDKAQTPTAAELDRTRILLARAAYLTRILNDTIKIAGMTEAIETTLADLRSIDVNGILRRLEIEANEPQNGPDETAALLPQRLLVPWGERINKLRAAIMDATVARVTARQSTREIQFDIVMTAFGAVMVAVLESVVLLSQRVVGPLAQLGVAITRIAAGQRSTPLILHSGTREINEMVTAVETLRQAALVADAAVLQHRLAARQRQEMLREALGIARTVQGPARALERGVASLSEGIDATIALITTPTTEPPPSLGFAAAAIRASLAEMRDCAAELDATFAAATSVQTEDRPETELVNHILAVRAQVDRRDTAVRGFVLPSLVALRDAAAAAGDAAGPALRDLVSDQFARVEDAVAVMSSMLAAVARATAIVRDLPMEDQTKLAA